LLSRWQSQHGQRQLMAFYTAPTTISGNSGKTADDSNDFFIAPTAHNYRSPLSLAQSAQDKHKLE